LKSRLSAKEKSIIRRVAETLVKKEDLVGVCVYGSRVAGHARKDSDYNVIIVAKDLKEGVKPAEVQESLRVSALIVDEEVLREEANKSSKDFVAGRFLNIYEPIIGAELLRRMELEYKRKVIAEGLTEIQSEYGGFSSSLIIPYEYFLYDRLQKRTVAYPDVTRPLADTYTSANGRRNLDFTIRGFREAAESLAIAGIVESTDESVRILPGEVPTNVLSKIVTLLSPAKEGTAQSVARGHDVLAGAGVVGSRARARRRSKKGSVESPVEFRRPKKLLRLQEGVVFDDASKMVEELARMSGFHGDYAFKQRNKGAAYNATQLLEISNHGKRVEYILKSFPDLKSVKWALLNLLALTGKKFKMTPYASLQREYEGVFRVRKLGIATHSIVGIAPDQKILVTKYVKGVPLSKFVGKITSGKGADTKYVERYAKTLAKLHKAGLVYGDTKAENVIVCEDEINLFDLEQTVENGDPAWDLAEFLYFSGRSAVKEEGMKLVADSFLASYREENGPRTIAKAKGVRYLLPFELFVAPSMISVIRDSLGRYSSATDGGKSRRAGSRG
jgi:tRNA A-37 threonylcarbamoyl transferase component Bud32/predicted nucleotidyltransferase